MKKILLFLLLFPAFVNAQVWVNGTIQKETSSGRIRYNQGTNLDSLMKLQLNSLANLDMVRYNSATGKFIPRTPAQVLSDIGAQASYPGLQDSLTKKANRNFDNVASGAIANVKLANSTISGISLGSTLNQLTAGNGINLPTSYTGATARVISADTSILAPLLHFYAPKNTVFGNNSLSSGQGSFQTSIAISGNGQFGKVIVNGSSDTGTPDAAIRIDRTLRTSTSSAHGISDQTNFYTGSGSRSYAGFDALQYFGGSNQTGFSHFYEFQARGAIATHGTLGTFSGYEFIPATNNGSIITNMYGFHVRDIVHPVDSSAATITNNIGLKIDSITVGTNKYGVLQRGSQLNLFEGAMTFPSFTLGSTAVTTTGTQLNYLSSATGTTGTASTNIMFSSSPTTTGTLTAAAANFSAAVNVSAANFQAGGGGTFTQGDFFVNASNATTYFGRLSSTGGNGSNGWVVQDRVGGIQGSLDGNGNFLTKTVNIATAPTTSAGSYDILTRNSSTGAVEKIANTGISSGTYTPTLTNGTNVASSVAFICHYIRVGNQVQVQGYFTTDPTLGLTASTIQISLPIASNFGTATDAEGFGTYQAAAAINQVDPVLYADTANDRIECAFTPPLITSQQVNFSFTYTVI